MHFPVYQADSVSKVIEKSLLDGIIDTVRTRALNSSDPYRLRGSCRDPPPKTPKARDSVEAQGVDPGAQAELQAAIDADGDRPGGGVRIRTRSHRVFGFVVSQTSA